MAVIEDEANKLKIVSYPNPSTSYFTIVPSGSKTGSLNVRVTDVLGRVIEVKPNLPVNNKFTIGQTYSRGIYFIEIKQGNEKILMKFIKH
jgi:expansin (peptidoglycan-binding protein)